MPLSLRRLIHRYNLSRITEHELFISRKSQTKDDKLYHPFQKSACVAVLSPYYLHGGRGDSSNQILDRGQSQLQNY